MGPAKNRVVDLLARWVPRLPFTAADGLPVLVYHKVGAYQPGALVKAHYVAPGLFRAHVALLARSGYRSVGVSEIVRYARGETLEVQRPIAITFDDGYDCLYFNAFPVLRQFGFRGIVFVVAGHIGGSNEWEPRRPAVVEPMLKAEHIVEMARGGIEFGSHGMTHRRLTRLEPGELRAELSDSKKALEDLTGAPVTALAYPYGDHNAQVAAVAAEVGYVAAFGAERGVVRPGANLFALRRVNIRRYNYLPLFARKLRRAYGAPRG